MNMKKITLLTVALCLAWVAQAQTEEEQVKQVVTSAYVLGVHNGGPIEDIRKGFHPSFQMLRLMNNELSPLPLEEWIANIEKMRANASAQNPGKAEVTFVNVAVAGTSASVVLELTRDKKKIFTDHLLLYKFQEGWRIVGKSFYRHP